MVLPGLFFEDCFGHYRSSVLTCKFKFKLISFYFEKKTLLENSFIGYNRQHHVNASR